jgi:formate dehydrogenase subunit gamma
VQTALGYIPPSTIPLIAEHVKLSRPEVYRAIDLSPSLSLKAAGKHTLYICNAENCCMQGGEALMSFACAYLGVKPFQTTADGEIRLEPFQCLGNCSMSPNVMLDGRIYGLMDEQELQKLLESADQK